MSNKVLKASKDGARGRSRTGTGVTPRGILSPREIGYITTAPEINIPLKSNNINARSKLCNIIKLIKCSLFLSFFEQNISGFLILRHKFVTTIF